MMGDLESLNTDAALEFAKMAAKNGGFDASKMPPLTMDGSSGSEGSGVVDTFTLAQTKETEGPETKPEVPEVDPVVLVEGCAKDLLKLIGGDDGKIQQGELDGFLNAAHLGGEDGEDLAMIGAWYAEQGEDVGEDKFVPFVFSLLADSEDPVHECYEVVHQYTIAKMFGPDTQLISEIM